MFIIREPSKNGGFIALIQMWAIHLRTYSAVCHEEAIKETSAILLLCRMPSSKTFPVFRKFGQFFLSHP